MNKDLKRKMSARQCEIAAESYTASLFSRSGYDVLVQYGANQPHYDLVIEKPNSKFVPVSVKGSQDGGWALAVRYKNKSNNYHEAIDKWLENQREDIVFSFIQFFGVKIEDTPRAYLAKPKEIAAQLKIQCDDRGYSSLQENIRMIRPTSKYTHKLPEYWRYSNDRLNKLI